MSGVSPDDAFWALAFDGSTRAWHWWPAADAFHKLRAPGPSQRRRRAPDRSNRPVCSPCGEAFEATSGTPLSGEEVFISSGVGHVFHDTPDCEWLVHRRSVHLEPVPLEFAMARGLLGCQVCTPEEAVHA